MDQQSMELKNMLKRQSGLMLTIIQSFSWKMTRNIENELVKTAIFTVTKYQKRRKASKITIGIPSDA